MSIVNLLAVPACLPIAVTAILGGIACVAAGWRGVLPAVLPGDEVFNFERVAGLTLRTLLSWPQPLDAPSIPGLAEDGLYAVIAGVVALLVGVAVNGMRRSINEVFVRSARDVRLVVLDAATTTIIPAEPTDLTTVLLGDRSSMVPRPQGLTTRLDADFLADTLPHCATNTRELLALGQDADANIDLARRLIALRQNLVPSRPLDRLIIRVDPRELRSSIGRDGFAEFADAAIDARLTSLPEARCRCLLRDQPPSKMRLVNRSGRATIVVIGLGETGLELLARLCAHAQSPSYDPLTIVVVDTEAPAVARELLELWPALSLAAEITPLALEPRLPQSAMSLFRYLHKEELVPTCVYIALEDAPLAGAWEHELSLAVRLFGLDSPLVLSVGHATVSDRSLLEEDERLELLQRQLHIGYLERRRAADDPASPALVEWFRLSFDLQEDNRSLADHLWTKARDLDLRIVPGKDDLAVGAAEVHIEALAAAEHRRWIASRGVAGWRFGETRSEAQRTHPSMIPWSQLTAGERARDIEVIRQIPKALRAAGLVARPLFGASVMRRGVDETNAKALVVETHSLACATADAVPHLVLAVEDGRSFRLAQRLTENPEVAVSLVLAQPLIGLAIAAGLPEQAASQLANLAQTVWITRPDSVDFVLGRWPTLTGGSA